MNTQESNISRCEFGQSELMQPGAELCIVLPTFNELPNINEVIKRVSTVLHDVSWEMIFVDDDSPDNTAECVREAARKDSRVRCIQRIGRRGLSSACIEGMLASSAPYLAVMDADLQHDETLLRDMLNALKDGAKTDIVIGSRYADGGSIGSWDDRRAMISTAAAKLSRLVLHAELTDPMSGLFMLKREVLEDCVRNLSGIGFKILVDIFASSPRPPKYLELPYKFRVRQAGESKLDNQAVWSYVMLLLDKLIGRFIPVRFVAFTLVGCLGLLVHLAVLAALLSFSQVSFVQGQTAATLVAMFGNYVLNNELTYRDKRLRGISWIKGWISFSLACSVGAFANIGVATYLFGRDTKWMVAAIAGVAVGAVWNYAITLVYTWKDSSGS